MAKLVVVSGGANGLGQGIVRRLARELRGAGQAVDFAPADVSVPADVARLGETATGLGDPLYGLVTNAGIFPRSKFLELSLEEWNRVIATNLTAPFLLTQTLAPALLAAGGGVVVNLS